MDVIGQHPDVLLRLNYSNTAMSQRPSGLAWPLETLTLGPRRYTYELRSLPAPAWALASTNALVVTSTSPDVPVFPYTTTIHCCILVIPILLAGSP